MTPRGGGAAGRAGAVASYQVRAALGVMALPNLKAPRHITQFRPVARAVAPAPSHKLLRPLPLGSRSRQAGGPEVINVIENFNWRVIGRKTGSHFSRSRV